MSRKAGKLVFDSNAGLSASQRIYSFLAILFVSFVFGAVLSSFVLGVYFTTDNLLNFFYGKMDNSQPLEINQTKSVKGKMHLLFVYGTLKKDCSRSSVLDSSRFIGLAKTTPDYKMYDCGSYPALVPSNNGGVWGELYEVDSSIMSRIDQIEGVDVGLYERSNIRLSEFFLVNLPLSEKTMDFLEKKITISYVYLHDVNSLVECGSIWTSSDK